MTQSIFVQKYDNGLVLLAEPMSWLESAAFALLTPAGCIYDPPDRLGLASFTCEMIERGCGPRNSRQYIEDLEMLGADTSTSVSTSHTAFGGAMLADNLPDVLSIYADVVQRPLFPEEEFEEARSVSLQEVRSLDDDLHRLVMNDLKHRLYPDPWGRTYHGSEEAISQITLSEVHGFFQSRYSPQGAILSVAGKIDWGKLRDLVGELFGTWKTTPGEPPAEIAGDWPVYEHLQRDSQQTHIAVGYEGVPYSDPNYYQGRGAIGVLSDGMSSRLFTQVREERGLSYSVYAMCHSLRDRGAVMAYAHTECQHAQTLCDVMLTEIHKLTKGIEPDELTRLKARVKRSLVMQQESSASRASEIASDWHYLGRAQTLAEISHIIDNLTCESINAYLAEHPPKNLHVVTMGGQGVECNTSQIT